MSIPAVAIDDAHASPARPWHVLVYRIPSEPTRLRATVWRRLKGLGAVYLQNSVAALPASANSERALRKLRHEISEMSGTAVLMLSTVLVGESTVMGVYQAARSEEYEEILDRCRDFLAGLEKEYAASHFTGVELGHRDRLREVHKAAGRCLQGVRHRQLSSLLISWHHDTSPGSVGPVSGARPAPCEVAPR
jgi:hypothetical protein